MPGRWQGGQAAEREVPAEELRALGIRPVAEMSPAEKLMSLHRCSGWVGVGVCIMFEMKTKTLVF